MVRRPGCGERLEPQRPFESDHEPAAPPSGCRPVQLLAHSAGAGIGAGPADHQRPYNLEFLGLGAEVAERQLEDALVAHLQRFLLELGAGFAFVGRQYRLEVGGEEFFADLLFYHLRLRRYVVIELKSGRFKPEYAGQLNFYVNAIDDLLKTPDDGLTLGILLCASRNERVVRYALHSINTPMAVANFTYRELPDDVRDALPADTALDATVRSALDEVRQADRPG